MSVLESTLIISVKEARKLLGADSKSMNDNQIVELIELLTSMGNDFLQDLGSTLYNGSHDSPRTTSAQ